MNSATLSVTVTSFTPPTCTCALAVTQQPTTGNVTVDANAGITISQPGGPINLVYQMETAGYYFVGIGLTNSVTEGSNEFPSINIDRTANDALTVLDNDDPNDSGVNYEYTLVIQDATGQMGCFDPRITTDY